MVVERAMVHFRCFKRAKRTSDRQKSCDAGIVLELSRELMHAAPFLPPLWGRVRLFGEVICSAAVNHDVTALRFYGFYVKC